MDKPHIVVCETKKSLLLTFCIFSTFLTDKFIFAVENRRRIFVEVIMSYTYICVQAPIRIHNYIRQVACVTGDVNSAAVSAQLTFSRQRQCSK